jgi:hypothetical protein
MKYSFARTASALSGAIAVFLFLSEFAGSPAGAAGEIVSSFRVPKWDDCERYMNGIVSVGSYYWICDSWDRGENYPPSIIKVNTSGSIVDSILNPTGKKYIIGLAYRGNVPNHGECLYVNAGETCYTYLITTAGSVVSSFNPGFHAGDLTWDGTYIYATNPKARMIFRFDPNGSCASSYNAPDADPSSGRIPFGLAHEGQYLWVSCYGKNDRIYKVRPSNGSIWSSFPVPNSYAHVTAITTGGGHLEYIDDARDFVFVVEK